jgi:type II secretory pathway pseudopilin PulG
MKRLPIAECRLPNAVSRRRSRHSTGFTLVEVLASLAVVMIALPVAMEAISLTSATASRAKRQLESANLAASKLAELVATNGWQNGNSSGDFTSYGASFPDYTWTSTVTQYQGTSAGSTFGSTTTTAGTTAGTTLQEQDVTVTWPAPAGKAMFSITLSTLVYSGSS